MLWNIMRSRRSMPSRSQQLTVWISYGNYNGLGHWATRIPVGPRM